MSGIEPLFDPLCAPFRLEGTRDEAVVLIHGFTGASAHWRPMAEFLNSHGYTVNVPLLAGHGTSMEDMARTTWRDWLQSARYAVDAMSGFERLHLVGLSMGGHIAFKLAGTSAAATVTAISAPVLARNKQIYLAPLLQRLRPRVMWPETEVDIEPEMERYWLTYPGFYTSKATDLLILTALGSLAAGRLRRPSLVIQSKVDESVDPRSAHFLARRLGRSAELVWLEHAFHNAVLSRERHVIHAQVLARIS